MVFINWQLLYPGDTVILSLNREFFLETHNSLDFHSVIYLSPCVIVESACWNGPG